MASQMCNKLKNTVFCLTNIVNCEKLCLWSEKHSFTIYYTSGADKLCLLQKNYVFQSKNKACRSINSVYQIENRVFPINCVFRSKKLSLSVGKHCLSNRKAVFYTLVFRSKNIVFLKTMFSVDKLCLST